MKNIKKALRLLWLAMFIALASFGMAISAAVLPGTRERYLNKETRTEQIDKKEEEEEKT